MVSKEAVSIPCDLREANVVLVPRECGGDWVFKGCVIAKQAP